MSRAKRQDLQGIRGFAIIAVLLFHFFPKQFPNGYIGVDQFFALSGYLIAMVLNKSSAIDLESMRSFYYRRIKRIIPLYALAILAISLALLRIFGEDSFDKNVGSAWSALTLTTNLRGNDPEKEYMALLTLAEDEFAHTWSLAVEMQFYLLVPIFFWVLRRIPVQFRILLSGGYHITADEYTAFNSVFARLWQFFSGIYAFMVTKRDEHERLELCQSEDRKLLLDEGGPEKPLNINSRSIILSNSIGFCCLTTLVMSLAPYTIPDLLLRVCIILQSVAMMTAGSLNQSFLVSNRLISYLGDISYAVYLVHWPIYSYCKQSYEEENTMVLYLGLGLSLILGAVLTETYEKFYLKLEPCRVFTLIAVIYFCCVLVLLPNTLRDYNESLETEEKLINDVQNYTREEVIAMNKKVIRNDGSTLYLRSCKHPNKKGSTHMNEWCQFEGVGNGTKKMMIIGNSYALNNAKPIYDHCRNKASRMTMYSATACEALVISVSKQKFGCTARYETLLKQVQKDGPDVLFMIFRHVEIYSFPRPKKTEKDALVEAAKNRLKEYSKVVKDQIFILDAIPRSKRTILNTINKGLEEGRLVSQSEVADGDWHLARERMKQIVKSCSKCELIDFMPSFTKNGTFRFFDDNGLSYFSNVVHITSPGKKLIEPVFEKLCKKL